jgi:hypothetical protein
VRHGCVDERKRRMPATAAGPLGVPIKEPIMVGLRQLLRSVFHPFTKRFWSARQSRGPR